VSSQLSTQLIDASKKAFVHRAPKPMKPRHYDQSDEAVDQPLRLALFHQEDLEGGRDLQPF